MDWLGGDLAPDEVPPENIWHHSRKLKDWFAAVKDRRKSGHETPGSEPDDDDGEFEENELVAEWRERAGLKTRG